jgi:ribose-phosphate pyrophosphokinase
MEEKNMWGKTSNADIKMNGLRLRMNEAEETIRELTKKLEEFQADNSNGHGYSIFMGNSNLPLGEKICAYLNVSPGQVFAGNFSDRESRIEIKENIRKKSSYIFQSTCPPVNDNLMEMLIMLDACKRSSDKSRVAVIPYFGYARQDKKSKSRDPITAKLVANLITVAGATRIILLEPHFPQIQGYFDIPVDNLQIGPIAADYIRANYCLDDLVIVSPDAGGVTRSRGVAIRLKNGGSECAGELSHELGVPVAMVDKRRSGPNKAKALRIVGNVKNKDCLILDDMIDTAGTLKEASVVLLKNQAKSVDVLCVHPIFSGPAIKRINSSPIRNVIVTDSVPLGSKALKCAKIKVLSVAELIGEAIRRSYTGESVSSLFE